MTRDVVDLLVIGGGINGAGIARDAAGRGHAVLLAERGDLGGATSSASSKLIHGGLRSLEHYEFRLVQEALAEREVMLRIAPHIVWPMRFVLPHRPEMRPRWMIRAGLFLYDNLARRVSLRGHEAIELRHHVYGEPLSETLQYAFAYSDCWVQDSRLVILNARDAARHGAEIAVRTTFAGARRDAQGWTCTLRAEDGSERIVRARVLVNAAGPWVMNVQEDAQTLAPGWVRRIRGSHIVVPRLYDGPQAYILQNDDRRVVFVIPYEREFSLIGTTDVPHDGDPAEAQCSRGEAAYLCDAVSKQFRVPVVPDDVVWSFAGVRLLYDDRTNNPSAIPRDYVLKLDTSGAPLLTIFGGKITTYRRLAEEAMQRLESYLPGGTPGWTAASPLPGGELGGRSFLEFLAWMARRYPMLPQATLRRMAHSYGSDLPALLGDDSDWGQEFGAGLTEREIDWLKREEWARSADDVLWRRTRLGLHMTEAQREQVRLHIGG